eukprot:TRINITY_DN1427_c0_g3_i1.p1 TRINITY_DN1427_c0_g3~~TRINITY_DN1427_c0_g3_i1.p1  ORF type:complete len:189 (-),score=64.87 TRINITY_DN1427_c0_g3_i1:71-637(-)
MIRVLGICGSLRKQSFNKQLLNYAQKLMPQGSQLVIFEDVHKLPLYNQDTEKESHPTVSELKRMILEADCILFASPEHNACVTAALKNVIDIGSRPMGDNSWNGKPWGVISGSPGVFGGVRSQLALRTIMLNLNGAPLQQPEFCLPQCHTKFDENGNLKDEFSSKLLAKYLDSLVLHARRFKAPVSKL